MTNETDADFAVKEFAVIFNVHPLDHNAVVGGEASNYEALTISRYQNSNTRWIMRRHPRIGPLRNVEIGDDSQQQHGHGFQPQLQHGLQPHLQLQHYGHGSGQPELTNFIAGGKKICFW